MFENHTVSPEYENPNNWNYVTTPVMEAPFVTSSSPYMEPIIFAPTASPQFYPTASPQFYAESSPVVFATSPTPPFYSTDILSMQPQNCNVMTTPMFSPFMHAVPTSPQMMMQSPANLVDSHQHPAPEMQQVEYYVNKMNNRMSHLSLEINENEPKNERCLRDNEGSLPNPLSLSKGETSMTLFDVMRSMSESTSSSSSCCPPPTITKKNNVKSNKRKGKDIPIPKSQFRRYNSGQFVSCALDRKESLRLQKEIADAILRNDHGKFENMYYQFLPEILRLSRDQYANFVLQRLIENLRIDLVDSFAKKVKEDAVAMATNQFSCRVLQSIIENCSSKLRLEIVENILPDSDELLRNTYGCYVLQKIVETTASKKLVPLLTNFVIPHYFDLCLHQYSCRVVQDILRYFPSEDKKQLTQCILKNILLICKNCYGNYVVQKMIHYGNRDVSRQICAALLPHIVDLCCNKAGSNILEKCFAKASDEDRALLIRPIIENQKNLKKIVQDKFGNYVLQKMLISLPYEKKIALCDALNEYFSHCNLTKLNKYEKFVYRKLRQN